MNKHNRAIVKKYTKAVLKELNCGVILKNVLKQKLDEDINVYAEEKEILAIEDLYLEFGEPKDMAKSMLNKEDYSNQLKKTKRKLFIWCVASIILLFLLLLSICFIIDMLDTYGYTSHVTDAVLK